MVADGLKRFPHAMQAVLPQTAAQTWIDHLRHCGLSLFSNRKRKDLARGTQAICRAKSLGAAQNLLDGFGGGPA